MRLRTIVLIVGIFLVAAFAALNVDEFTRSSVLSLGFTTVQAPLGIVMLVLLVIAVVIFLASTLYIQGVNLVETRRYARELNTQRELADKAEVSRFTELRSFIEAQSIAANNRDTSNAAVLAERLAHMQTALMHRLDQSDNSTAAIVGQLDDTLGPQKHLVARPGTLQK